MSTVVEIDTNTVNLWIDQGLESGIWSGEGIDAAVTAVNKGATLLDKKKPGWVKNVVPSMLRMSSASFCIIGQTYGNYDQYVGVTFGSDEYDGTSETYERAIEHGFMISSDSKPYPWELLDRVWVYMLTMRAKLDTQVELSLQ